MRNLIFILGDQLSSNISSLQNFSKDQDEILIAEISNEANYVKHHKKKLVFIFSAMRHFYQELIEDGFKVNYIKLEENKFDNFSKTLINFIKKHNPEKIIITEPSEFRVLQEFEILKQNLECDLIIKEDTRFIATHQDFQNYAKGKKQFLMEYFYRLMRKKTNFLMQKNKPLFDRWNFDKENRDSMPENINPPKILKFKADKITKEVIEMVDKNFSNNFGKTANFEYAVSKKDADFAFIDFINNRLKNFGKYQDAMKENLEFGFHSIISLYLNIGLLDPFEVCKKVEQAYFEDKCDINSAEGFIRQIIGWREYIRGIYWHFMPQYKKLNFFNAKRKLPQFYWDFNKTKMNCIKQVVKQTYDNAYSHHIQRLMITGNFALLSAISPDEINDWYMAVYFDAFEWVELPNTNGMAIFADGGIVASKPYAASGNYINKMSNFCKNCYYNVKETTEEKACPFNFLYWNFLIENQEKLQKNQRMRFPYLNLVKKSENEIQKIKQKSQNFLDNL